MNRMALLSLAGLMASVPLPAQNPTSVTLFNSGRVLVRQSLPLELAAGPSTHPVSLGLFAPESFAALDPGVTVTGVRFDPGTSEDALLRRNIGRTFTFEQGNGTTTAKLLAVDPERWSGSDGHVAFGRPGRILWPPELVPLAPTTDISFQSDRARGTVNVMYQTSGGSWSAAYRLYLGAAGRMEGVAQIQGGTLTAGNAVVQLLAGNIGSPGPMPSPMMARKAGFAEDAAIASGQAATEFAVGEAHLYTLPARVTFVPGTALVLPLFEPAPAKAERRYTVEGGLPFYGSFGQQPDEQDVPVAVGYYLERKAGTAFGDLPLPAGSVSVFDIDRDGRVQLIGMSQIDHTAPGEALTVNTGTAFDVTAKRVQTDFSTARSGTAPVRTIATIGYRVTLQNAKDSSVAVEVREDRSGEWSVIQSSVPAQRRSSSRVVFRVTVPAKGSATLTYSLRVVW
jgi:hypothetical protein